MNDFPKIIHLMYFPWDRNQKLKDDENDFDHTFYNVIAERNPGWEIRLWTLSKTKEFVDQRYPGLWENMWGLFVRPTQAVDFFRLLVTHEFGGIYWQYESEQLVDLKRFIPTGRAKIKLFVETNISRDFSKKMAEQPIRNGKPEEIRRICNQIFSAYPQNDFLNYCIEKSKRNLQTFSVFCDYDILYIGANAMFSEAYHGYGDYSYIQVVSRFFRKRMIKLVCRGSWRTD